MGAGDAIADEIERLEREFPTLGPASEVKQLRIQSMSGAFYHPASILAKVSLVLGRVSAALEEDADPPVINVKEFPFIQDQELRQILDRDYAEAQRAFVAQCWKSAIILAGGAIEAVLLDLVLRDPAA